LHFQFVIGIYVEPDNSQSEWERAINPPQKDALLLISDTKTRIIADTIILIKYLMTDHTHRFWF